MEMNISIVRKDTPFSAFELGDKIHGLFAGNKDYVDSNIILNFDNDDKEVNLYFITEDLPDKEYVKKKLKESIDIAIDTFYAGK